MFSNRLKYDGTRDVLQHDFVRLLAASSLQSEPCGGTLGLSAQTEQTGNKLKHLGRRLTDQNSCRLRAR